ncbi:MAG: hypothetical protein Q9162_005365 [Coniocarpon cinnabarinum]
MGLMPERRFKGTEVVKIRAPNVKTPIKSIQAKPLETLSERDEANAKATAAITSPPAMQTTPSKTPVKPGAEEMHPTLFHSAIKKQASEHHFGYGGKSANVASPASPQTPEKQQSSKSFIPKPPQSAPPARITKARTSIAPDDYPFTFRRPSIELSSEAQQIMDSVRDEAARIKLQLALQRDKQMEEDGNADTMFGTRKVAHPKGKLSRFSDVHLDQFRKMDSIANHASSFRADPGRPAKIPSPSKGLKRTNSKVDLDPSSTPQSAKKGPATADHLGSNGASHELKRTASKSNIPSPIKSTGSGSVTNIPNESKDSTPQQGPAKRRKTMFESNIAAAAAPGSSHVETATSPIKASQIPRSPSAKSLIPTTPEHVPSAMKTPALPQTAPPARASRGTFVSKLLPFKSILRKPQLKFSSDPLKQAAGTHVAPSASETATPERKNPKHVDFTPEPARVIELSPAVTPRSTLGADEAQTIREVEQNDVDVSWVTEAEEDKGGEDMDVDEPASTTATEIAAPVSYPSLNAAQTSSHAPAKLQNEEPTKAGDFTFTFNPASQISFASPPPASKPSSKPSMTTAEPSRPTTSNQPHLSSPSPATTKTLQKSSSQPHFLTPTASSKFRAQTNATNSPGTPTPLRKTHSAILNTPKTDKASFKSIEHGLSNKKRKRDINDLGAKDAKSTSSEHDDDDKENGTESPSKKLKFAPAPPTNTPGKARNAQTPKSLKEREKRMSLKSPGKASAMQRLFSPRNGEGKGSPVKGSPVKAGHERGSVSSPGSAKKLSWARLEALAMPKRRA